MMIEVKLVSSRVPGLTRSTKFNINELVSIPEFLSHELQDEIDKVRSDENRFLEFISGKGNKIRF